MRADGARNQFYEYMREVEPGDVIFSFYETQIKVIGVAVAQAETAPKPDFGNAGANWSNEGWLVRVEFKELSTPPRPKDHIDIIRPHLPDKYAPLQKTGDGLQSVYLTELPISLANVLIQLIGDEYQLSFALLQAGIYDFEEINDKNEEAIKGRVDIGPTTKDQLVKSRRGQGIFKANVRLNEKRCRVDLPPAI